MCGLPHLFYVVPMWSMDRTQGYVIADKHSTSWATPPSQQPLVLLMMKLPCFLKKQNLHPPTLDLLGLAKGPCDSIKRPRTLTSEPVSESESFILKESLFLVFFSDRKPTNIRIKGVKGPRKMKASVSQRLKKKPTLYVLLRTTQLEVIATDIAGLPPLWRAEVGSQGLSWVHVWKDSDTGTVYMGLPPTGHTGLGWALLGAHSGVFLYLDCKQYTQEWRDL